MLTHKSLTAGRDHDNTACTHMTCTHVTETIQKYMTVKLAHQFPLILMKPRLIANN